MRYDSEFAKLTISRQQKEIHELEDANAALQRKFPEQRELNQLLKKESKMKLSKLLEKFSLVEKFVPEIPKIKDRIREVELVQHDMRGLYRDVCLKDEVDALLVQYKSETAAYIDNAMKQWEYEYRKGHEEMVKKYDEVRGYAREILPKGRFKQYEHK